MRRAGPRKVQRYTLEFRLKAVKLSQLKGVEVQAVADALEIHPFMLSKWRREARDGVLRGRVSVAAAVTKTPRAREAGPDHSRGDACDLRGQRRDVRKSATVPRADEAWPPDQSSPGRAVDARRRLAGAQRAGLPTHDWHPSLVRAAPESGRPDAGDAPESDLDRGPDVSGRRRPVVVLHRDPRPILPTCLGVATDHDPRRPGYSRRRGCRTSASPPRSRLIFHSDRGSEFLGLPFRQRLVVAGVQQSMTRGGAPDENAHMESFFHSLKSELTHGRTFVSVAELRQALRRYVQ